MKRVGVREFREQASALLAGEETFIVERHGSPIGYYVPLQHRTQDKKQKALDRMDVAMEELRKAASMTTEEFEAELLEGLPGYPD